MGYGYCPKCGALGRTRERRPNGNDTCQNGHVYPSADATSRLKADTMEALKAELADLRRRLDESERVAAAYRADAHTHRVWWHVHTGGNPHTADAAMNQQLDEIRDRALKGEGK